MIHDDCYCLVLLSCQLAFELSEKNWLCWDHLSTDMTQLVLLWLPGVLIWLNCCLLFAMVLLSRHWNGNRHMVVAFSWPEFLVSPISLPILLIDNDRWPSYQCHCINLAWSLLAWVLASRILASSNDGVRENVSGPVILSLLLVVLLMVLLTSLLYECYGLVCHDCGVIIRSIPPISPSPSFSLLS